MANELNTRPIPELPINSSPSDSAQVVGVDGGIVSLIPSSALPNGGGSGGGIVTVDALPTEGNADTIYKVYEVDDLWMVGFEGEEGNFEAVTADYTQTGTYIELVNELPDMGEPYIDTTTYQQYAYYNRTDGKFYAYITSELTQMLQMPPGWLCMNDVMQTSVISSLDQATDTSGDTNYFLEIKKPHLYIYESRWVEIPIGFRMVPNPRLKTITFVES